MTISVATSMSFSGFEIESIATLIHIANLDHQHDSIDDHDHHESGGHHESSPTEKKQNFKITHTHPSDDAKDGNEPHEHVINLGLSAVAIVKEPLPNGFVAVEGTTYTPSYIQNWITTPDLDGLFRPPKS